MEQRAREPLLVLLRRRLGLERDNRREREALRAHRQPSYVRHSAEVCTHRCDTVRDAIRRAELVAQRVREPERGVLVELERPKAHPGRDLEFLPRRDVLRVRL